MLRDAPNIQSSEALWAKPMDEILAGMMREMSIYFPPVRAYPH